jgi:16S rRNA (guanine(966)-N(2))-methyltransferase RsmD
MGAEALCRGAKQVVGIESSAVACRIIQANWQKVAQPQQNWQLLRGDVRKRLPTLVGQQFDHIYFDPPYASDLYEPVLGAIAQSQLLDPTGELAVEHDPKAAVIKVPGLRIDRQKVYGNTAMTFYRHT